MPFKPVELPKCPKCEKSVYAAEEKLAGGHKWHKACFKCSMCNKMLDSTSCAEHDGALYCKVCHGRKFGPKGYGFGGGAGALNTDTGEKFGNTEFQTNGHNSPSSGIAAPEGQGCPRCSCFVYHADQIFSKNQVWHKQCFKCRTCHKQLDSRSACDGPDSDVYCTGCYRKKFGIKGYGFGQGGPALISGDQAESVDSVPATSRFIDTTTIQAEGGHGCPRCGGSVFHAEQMFSKNRTYHKKCFSCKSCKRPLDSVLACDGPDNDIYCRGCYGKSFGAKGYGFAGGSGFLQCGDFEDNVADRPTLAINTTTIKGDAEDAKETCPRCGGKVFHAEKMLSKNHVFHKTCFHCLECHRPLDSVSCCDSPDGEIFCRPCYGKNFGPHGYGYGGVGSVPALTAAGPGTHEEERPLIDFHPVTSGGEAQTKGEDGCKRCNYRVYDAEKLMAAGRSWHKRCFSCLACSRHLDSTTVNDGPDGEIYCRSCHSGAFGMTGYGFGQGAGTLLSDGHSTRTIAISAESAFILP